MDPASGQRPCETVFVAIKVLDSTLAKLSAADFARIHHQTQAAIDPNCASYPSYKKTQQHLRDVLPDVTLVSLTSDDAMKALEANVKAKAPYMLSSHEQDKPSLSLSELPNYSFGRGYESPLSPARATAGAVPPPMCRAAVLKGGPCFAALPRALDVLSDSVLPLRYIGETRLFLCAKDRRAIWT